MCGFQDAVSINFAESCGEIRYLAGFCGREWGEDGDGFAAFANLDGVPGCDHVQHAGCLVLDFSNSCLFHL